MKDACLTADEIADLARGIATADEEHHLDRCGSCRQRVTLLRRIAAAGVGRIAEVAGEVDDLVDRLLDAPRATWWKIVRQADYQRGDVARRLLALAIDARLKDRTLAVALAKAATAIVDSLPDRDAAELRFEAWKFSSAILREAGRYSELPEAFRKAEAAARSTANPELADASLCLSRALLYAEPDIWRPDEASGLLDRAERVFAERDKARVLAVLTTRAFLLFRSGDLASASKLFAMLVDATSSNSDQGHLDALANWLAVQIELREAGSNIEQTLGYLLKEHRRAGRTVQIARARWMMGRLHVVRGEYHEAIESLREAMDQIDDSDASLRIGLDTVEALLLADSYHDAYTLAHGLASAAVALDQREPTRRHNLTTQVFAYLRDAARREALTADLVTECARYLDRITRQRPLEFVPPMPLTEM